MTDTEQIILKMNEGFGKIHDRFNTLADQTSTRQIACGARFGQIEQSIGIRNAVETLKEGNLKRKVDFQSSLVRAALIMIIGSCGAIIWKLFIAHVPLISG